MNKKEKIEIRVTAEENECIIQECKNRGITKSTYVRQKIFKAEKEIIYDKEFKECLENINGLVMDLKAIVDNEAAVLVDKLIAEVGKEWQFLNR
ncbi:hypothetical protein AALA78_16605 [Lachnospiraceae bacterium 42-17]|jgi:hypothetical protein|nr:hypothetical protein [Dorea sp.]